MDYEEKRFGDNAYDSDGLEKSLADERGIEMIAPHRRGKKIRQAKTAGHWGVIDAAGKLSVFLPGSNILGGW